jgi:hypothetical protein
MTAKPGCQTILPPCSCQPGFGALAMNATHGSIVTANPTLAWARKASARTPEESATMIKDDTSRSMRKVVLAITEVIRACKAETLSRRNPGSRAYAPGRSA